MRAPSRANETSRPRTWNEVLAGRISERLAREIDIYETQMQLRRQGKLDEKIFAETRLRRGVYGQRYDNGQRHDGFTPRQLAYPSGELEKGPSTVWDAPGMMRVKIPFGGLDAEQLEVLAELAEEYSDGIAHVTTRQDFQLHFVHIDDTPDLMRRLAAASITTQEACGNSVRNVTGCPLSGVCADEAFDVSPYAHALARFLLGHKDAQDFGRKFKISFSGCAEKPCALAHMHDLGLVAKVAKAHGDDEGEAGPGFAVYVGGGLGAVPHQAKLLYDFLPAAELLPVAQAICRVFARLGEKRNRGRARIKFLVAKLGIDEFRRLVEAERRILPPDESWSSWLTDLGITDETPTRPPSAGPAGATSAACRSFERTNTAAQRQAGYSVVTVHLPLGDLTAAQLRALADISRRYNGGRLRTTVEQNLVLRFISRGDLPELHRELAAVGLAEAGAGTLVDITACPGTDTCKLGISSSRGLAAELMRRVAQNGFRRDEAIQSLRIKVSGCFNSCGQHHIADIGFYGVSRKHGKHTVPHFQVILGGQQRDNAAAYGLAVVAVPSKRIPEVVDRVTRFYVDERQPDEAFQAFVKRVGKARIRALLEDLTSIPDYSEDPSMFSDWGDPREYTIGDLGVGECAGEVVSLVQFGLAASERQVFEAQVLLEEGAIEDAADKAYRAMLQAAKAITLSQDIDVPDDPDLIVAEFKGRFVDTELFHDRFAGSKFSGYLFAAHAEPLVGPSDEDVHRRIEEAQLFIEAAHSFYNRLSEGAA